MRCTKCEGKTQITETRTSPFGIRRRHKCTSCKHRFTTVEITMSEYTSITGQLKKFKNIPKELKEILKNYISEEGAV